MISDETRKKIADFESKHKQFKVLVGGDGCIAAGWRENRRKALFPFRNYGLCPLHQGMLDSFLSTDGKNGEDGFEYRQTLHPLIGIYDSGMKLMQDAISEVQIRSTDCTGAIRFNVSVNDKLFYQNVIADAIIASTVYGSTGYWQSITRTIFRSGLGLAFIAPTQGVNSLILSASDRVTIDVVRTPENDSLFMAADKLRWTQENVAGAGRFNIQLTSDNVSIFGLSNFHCYECRKLRNGTILQNQYIV